jgi:hypothetical protein
MGATHPSSIAAVVALVVLFGASCSQETGDSVAESASTAPPIDQAVPETSSSTTAEAEGPRPPGSDGVGEPRVIDFGAPTEVGCTGTDAAVPLRYETEGATIVAFIVDNRSARTDDPPPLSGEFSITVPCDGNAHTVVLAAASPAGPSLATRVVKTIPSGDAPAGEEDSGQ